MRTAKSAFSNRISRSPGEVQSPLYMTRREKLVKSPGLIQTLKTRKNFRKVSPEHAAEVIKNYVLPLFEQKVRKSSKVKQESSDSSFNLAGCKSAMAEEIFLSTKLYDKLKKSEESRQRLVEKCSQFEQNFENHLDDEKKFEMLYLESQSQLQMMIMENGNLLKIINGSQGEIMNIGSEKDFYREKYHQLQQEVSGLREELEKARSDLDIRLF
jgi:hypothetical protein